MCAKKNIREKYIYLKYIRKIYIRTVEVRDTHNHTSGIFAFVAVHLTTLFGYSGAQEGKENFYFSLYVSVQLVISTRLHDIS